MKSKKLMDAVTGVPDAMIEEAKDPAAVKRPRLLSVRPGRWKKIAAAACALVLLAGGISAALKIFRPVRESLASPLVKVSPAEPYSDFHDRDVAPDFLHALNRFSYETASVLLSGNSGNINYSPVSLYYSLAVAASGSSGETREELLELLNMESVQELSSQCAHFQRASALDDETSKLKLSNSIWMNHSVKWKKAFLENAAENFYAAAFSVDMADPATPKAIGQWISDETEGTLNPDVALSPNTIMMILNTVYFHDQWLYAFHEGATEEKPFYLSDSTSVSCSFMSNISNSAFSRGDDYTRASLPLKGGGEMVFILPDEGVSPQELLSSPEKTQETFEGGEKQTGEVTWEVPVFGFQTRLELKDMLEDLGILSAFESDADFSGLTDTPAWISGVTQETHISVNEKGVEASAFTELALAGSSMEPDTPAEMILNRPFLYGITTSQGALLFAGICENPSVQ